MSRPRISLRSLLLGMTLVGCSVWLVLDEGPWQRVGELTTPNSSGQFALSRDGKHVAVACEAYDRQGPVSHLYVWDISERKSLWDTDEVFSVDHFALSKSGKHIAYVDVPRGVSPRRRLVVARVDSGRSRVLLETHIEVKDVAFDRNGNLVAVVSPGSVPTSYYVNVAPTKILCWNTDSGELLRAHEVNSAFKSATLSPDGTRVAAIHYPIRFDGSRVMTVWDTLTGKQLWQREFQGGIKVARWSSEAQGVDVIEYDSDRVGYNLAAYEQVLAAETGIEQSTIKRNQGEIVSPDLKRSVAHYEPAIMRASDGEALARLDTKMAERLCFSEDGRHVINIWSSGIEIWRRVRPEGLIGYAYDYRAWLAGCSLLALLASLVVDVVRGRRGQKQDSATLDLEG